MKGLSTIGRPGVNGCSDRRSFGARRHAFFEPLVLKVRRIVGANVLDRRIYVGRDEKQLAGPWLYEFLFDARVELLEEVLVVVSDVQEHDRLVVIRKLLADDDFENFFESPEPARHGDERVTALFHHRFSL